MSGVQLFIIIITLPFAAALGHDIWLSYQAGLEHIKLTSIGFIWTTYSPESFRWAVDNLGQGFWNIANALLPYKAVYVTGALPGVFCPLLLILKISGLWPFQAFAMDHSSKLKRGRR